MIAQRAKAVDVIPPNNECLTVCKETPSVLFLMSFISLLFAGKESSNENATEECFKYMKNVLFFYGM